MKHELAVATQNWGLMSKESKALIDRSLDILDRKDIGNNRMSPYQLENFVLDEEHPTDWGKYKQAIAEIESRVMILMSDHIQYRKHRADRQKALWWIRWLRPIRWVGWVEAHCQWKEAEAQQCEVSFRSLERHIEHCLLELKTFEAKAQMYVNLVGDQDVIKLETEYWQARKEYFDRKAMEETTKNVARMMMAQKVIREEMREANGHGTL